MRNALQTFADLKKTLQIELSPRFGVESIKGLFTKYCWIFVGKKIGLGLVLRLRLKDTL